MSTARSRAASAWGVTPAVAHGFKSREPEDAEARPTSEPPPDPAIDLEPFGAAWERIAGSAFADFTLAEANSVPRIRSFVQDCADTYGTGAADSIKSLLSSVITLAVDDGALESNACRLVRPAKRASEAAGELSSRDKALLAAGWTLTEIQPDHERAFTADERAAVIARASADEALDGTARRADAADLVAFMAAVGTRIEEALSVRWEGVDLDAGMVHVPGTKTETSDRTLEVAPWLLYTLRARWRLEGSPSKGFVFHAPLGGLEAKRDRRNASRALRRVLDAAGHPWAVPHTFRRTVATLLDQRGVPLAQIADYLGHSDPTMTARVYLGRKMSPSLAASKP